MPRGAGAGDPSGPGEPSDGDPSAHGEPSGPGDPSGPGEPSDGDPSAHGDPSDGDGPAAGLSHPARRVIEWVLIIAGAVGAALVVKAFLLQAFYIPSSSMEPTLQIGDRVFVNKLAYRMGEPHRGDIVVFERPGGPEDGISDLIKRVIAVGGERVEGRDGAVWVDGRRLAEPYLPPGTWTSSFGPVVIPEGHVWVMGDNRGQSRDSRFFGPVPTSAIVGRAFVRIWPLTRIDFL